jgi:hypothetical protein
MCSKQVREAGAAGDFVLRADVIPDVDGNERRRMVFVEDDVEPVGQLVVVDADPLCREGESDE